jgi:hypothetical protein
MEAAQTDPRPKTRIGPREITNSGIVAIGSVAAWQRDVLFHRDPVAAVVVFDVRHVGLHESQAATAGNF